MSVIQNDIGEFVPIRGGTYYTLVSLHRVSMLEGYYLDITPQKYATIEKGEFRQLLSHFILGKPSKGCVIDHINGNTLDNRDSNLREATRAQNIQNRIKQQNKYSSNFLNVSTKDSKWVANVRGGSERYTESFDTEENAAKAADKAIIYYYGVQAKTNGTLTEEEIQLALKTRPISKRKLRRLNFERGVWYDKRSNKFTVELGKKCIGRYTSLAEANQVAC
jgi:HNH endonuclease